MKAFKIDNEYQLDTYEPGYDESAHLFDSLLDLIVFLNEQGMPSNDITHLILIFSEYKHVSVDIGINMSVIYWNDLSLC